MAVIQRTLATGNVAFYADFEDQHGRRVREYVGEAKPDANTARRARRMDALRDEALVTLAARRTAVKRGTYVHPDDARDAAQEAARAAAEAAQAEAAARGPSFRTVAEEFLADRATRCRSGHYGPPVAAMIAYFGDRPVREITLDECEAFATWRRSHAGHNKKRKSVSDSTMRNNLTALKTLFAYARRRKLIPASPAVDVEMPALAPHRTRWLTADEYTRLEAAAPPWLRPILRLAVLTGLRLREIVEARWEDFDPKTSRLFLTGENKTRSVRAVVLSPEAKAVIGAQLRHVRSPYVFTHGAGETFTSTRERARISKVTREAARSAGLTAVSFHTLRHTAASWAVQAGVPLFEVQKMLGHSDPRLTQRYADLAPEHLARAVEAVAAAFRCHQSDNGAEGEQTAKVVSGSQKTVSGVGP